MQEELDAIRARAEADIDAAEDLDSLERLRVAYLGKKGELTNLLKQVGQLEPEARKAAGQAVNAAKDAVQQRLEARREELARIELDRRLEAERVDVSLPGRDA
ncbi:MAG: phenylalanine--tRNA ligase subunit alpha, partial [Thiohalorhabdaceae bacterium]